MRAPFPREVSLQTYRTTRRFFIKKEVCPIMQEEPTVKTCYIVGAGEGFVPFTPGKEDLVIAADGGYRILQQNGIKPDLTVGDFDSLGDPPEQEEVIRHPVMKNDTDTLLAVRIGLERGYLRFVLTAGTGGRLEHTLANLQTLIFISQNGGEGFLKSPGQTAAAITDRKICFDETYRGGISVFADGKAEGVTEEGLLYQLDKVVLESSFPIGVSNEFTGKPAFVEVKKGTLILLWDEK